MKETNTTPMSYDEFVSAIREFNQTGISRYLAMNSFVAHLPENIKFHPGDMVMVEDLYPVHADYPEMVGLGVVVMVPQSLRECYYEYRDGFNEWMRGGGSAESFYGDLEACFYSDGLDYGVLFGPYMPGEDVTGNPICFTDCSQLHPVPENLSNKKKSLLKSWYEQYAKEKEEKQKEEKRIVELAMKEVDPEKRSNPRYILFRDYDGKWGTRTADGALDYKAIFTAVESDGGVLFSDGGGGVCRYDPDEGMDLLAWSQPWWENTMCGAHFPQDLDHYWWDRRLDRLDLFDEIWIQNAMGLDGLSPLQRRILDDLEFTCRYVDALSSDGDEDEKLEKQWFAAHPNDLSNNERVASLAELVRRPDLPEKMKEAIWFANFMFIEYFCFLAPDKKQNEIDWK